MKNIQLWAYQSRYWLGFLAIGAIYACNLFIEVMEVDAAQYASIAREMSESGSYLEVYHRGKDYLDKPPLLFWLAAVSFNIFGVSTFAYKLPAVLTLLLGLYATYQLGRMWYSRQVGLLAALILATTQAFFLMTNDIRTDGLLTGWVIVGIWQLYAYLREGRWANLLGAATAIALALLTKGPIGLVIPALALGSDLLLKRDWRGIFKWQWLVFLAVIAALLLPMCYGLYQQFDLHPEKEVYGLKGPSGLKFFFWTQSFGRISGDIYWDNGAGPLYFLQTILWDFQPWIFLFIPAFCWKAAQLWKSRLRPAMNNEFFTFFGFLLVFLALSNSNYKLPHYIFPLFPFAALMTAEWLIQLQETSTRWLRPLSVAYFGVMHLFFGGILIGFVYCFAPSNVVLPIIMALGFVVFWWAFLSLKKPLERLIWPTLVSISCFGGMLALHFYPNLLEYQSTNLVGKKITAAAIPEDRFYVYKMFGHGLEFYGQRIVDGIKPSDLDTLPSGTWIFTNEAGLQTLNEQAPGRLHLLEEYQDYKVAQLKIPFLNKKTRAEVLKPTYLLEIE